MSWLVGVLVAAAVLTARGPGGRSPARIAVRPGPDADAGAGTGSVPRGVPAGPWGPLLRVLRRRHLAAQGSLTGPDLALLVTDVAARLRSGADPLTAWEQALGRPVPPGGPTVTDLARLPGERDGAAVVVVAGRLAAELGAPLAPLLDGVAATLAAQAEADGDRRAALAGPQATARVLTGLPVLGVLLGTAIGADPLAVLLDGALGSVALACGGGLLLAGRVWTARLARSAASAGRAS
ncbi:hypothetical protein [Cellulomonas sp. ATA003]|uniref:type II secretion system F family protein n=1 Tax=Cellulomonas sp. ATA003 TaxID=3073064 RepID=UPI002872BDD2|nr:hypothetical protein [Cellulomonas sp. ATA003]WNB85354.1 hypothetical protein REH70_17410 [Cellulomonas sp. ATA003]